MTELSITEAAAVQMPMVLYAAGVGWTPVPPQEPLVRRGETYRLIYVVCWWKCWSRCCTG